MAASSDGPGPNQSASDGPSFEYWLDLLRDGSEDEKARARTEIGIILEARGQVEAAADAYLTNVKLRVRDRRPYERLAAICRAKGDPEWEARTLLAMQSVFAATPSHIQSVPASPLSSISRRHIVRVFAAAVLLGLVLAGGVLLMFRPLNWSQVPGRIVARIWPSTSSPLVTTSGLPCANPVGHFPEWADPENSVLQAAIATFGNTRFNSNPGALAIWRVALDEPEPTLAGWMAAELVARHSGNPGPTLPEYIGQTTRLRMALGPAYKSWPFPVIWNTTPRADWELLLKLPNSTCTGALLQHPANVRLVRLMSASQQPVSP